MNLFKVKKRTTTDEFTIRRVTTCCNFGSSATLFRFYHDDGLLLALVLDIPYSA